MTVPDAGPPAGPRRRGWRPVAGAALLTTLAVAAAAAGPAVVSRARSAGPGTSDAVTATGTVGAGSARTPGRATGAAAVAAPVCPAGSTYPTRDPAGYAVAVKASISDITILNGWNEQTLNWQSVASNITAQACGLLQLPSLQVTIAPEGLVFDTSKVDIVTLIGTVPLFQPGEVGVKLAPTGPATTVVSGVEPGTGRLELAATTPIKADVINGPKNLGVFDCPTSASATLTTGVSPKIPTGRGPDGPHMPGRPDLPAWTVAGTPLDGAIVGAHALVVGNDFPLPVFVAEGDCVFNAALFNGVFAGADAAGDTYYDQRTYGPVHPPGASQVIGTLTITSIDPDALPVGPPATIPGT